MLASQRPTSGPVAHGGSLAAARKLFPGAPKPFLDLSTGINPSAYPMPPLSTDAFTRLPEPEDVDRLLAIAAHRYRAPSAAHVVVAPGTQILLSLVARLVPPSSARVLGPTYAEHVRAAAVAGHEAREVASIAELSHAGLVVVVNPNNPDGRLISREDLLRLARDAHRRDGLLVLDEAFMDVGPDAASLAAAVDQPGLVVLRSFGKFYGLAGVRLGFALAHPDVVRRLREMLGPWAVSGPALAAGTVALADQAWAARTRERLRSEATRLDAVLTRGGLAPVGGTSLFRTAKGDPDIFGRLGRRGIIVRHFEERPGLLRFGLPSGPAELDRLAAAFSAD